MDDMLRIVQGGPSGGVAMAIIAVGIAIVYVLYKAVPVSREYVKIGLELRAGLLEQDARVASLAYRADTADRKIEDLARENAVLRAEVERLRAEVAELAPPTPGDDPEADPQPGGPP